MRHILFYILFFYSSMPLYAQEVDTVLIKQFSYSDYNAGITNYSGISGPDGYVYFANSQGVLIYDGSDWELLTVANDKRVQTLCYQNDTLFIGSNDEIGYFVKTNNKWIYSSLNPLLDNAEQLDDIWQIVKSKDGLYFVSYNDIYLYNGKKILPVGIHDSYLFNVDDLLIASSFYEEIKYIEYDSVSTTHFAPQLSNDAVYRIFPAMEDSTYLLVTSEHGIFKFTVDPFKLEFWDTPISNQIIKDGFYHGIEYHDSLVVCTTWEHGIIIFNKKGDVLKQIDIESGLPNRSLLELFIDDNENIWIPSRTGIYQMRLSLDRKSSDFRARTMIKKIVTEVGEVANLQNIQDPDFLVFDYTTPGFNKEDLEYSFYLEGYDKNWSDWAKLYKKEYSNLDNGEHVFHVKARPIGSVIESEEAQIDFRVILPWYKRPISYFILAFGIIVGILILVRIRIIRQRRSKLALERIISERTAELIEEREKLKRLNNDLQIANTELDNFVYRSSHDLVAPLKSLEGLMALTKLETDDPRLLDYVGMMESSVLKLEKFISSIMDYSVNAKSEQEIMNISVEEVIDEICDDIQFFDKYSSIKIIKEIKAAQIKTDYKRLKIVLNNLITNAIKYHNISQENPWIKLSSYIEGDQVILEVTDNGLGIESIHLEKIFDMFYRASANSEGSGLGLYIVKDTMKRLKGEVTITSEINKGSTFTLKFQSQS